MAVISPMGTTKKGGTSTTHGANFLQQSTLFNEIVAFSVERWQVAQRPSMMQLDHLMILTT